LKSGYFLGKIKNGNLSYPEEWLITAGGLTAIAGATNHGKTDFLINTCLNVSRNYPEKKFIYLTYEQSRRDIFLRFLNSFSDIDITSTRSNVRAIKNYYKYGKTENHNIFVKFKKKEAEFFEEYIDTGRLIIKQVSYNSEDINSTIEQLCKEDNSIGGFFIDYYQKLELPKDNKKRESRVEELKEIGQRLNDLCIKTGIPIVLGAQFNRKVMSPEDMFPQNIGEAGDIERILDTLIAIWNTSKKLRKHEKEEGNTLEEKGIARYEGTGEYNGKSEIKKLVGIPGRLYIEVLKSRDTETGLEALLDYNGKLGSIKNQQESKSNF
jgi:replicative DNA helicase